MVIDSALSYLFVFYNLSGSGTTKWIGNDTIYTLTWKTSVNKLKMRIVILAHVSGVFYDVEVETDHKLR